MTTKDNKKVEDIEEDEVTGYTEIKMGGGWFMTISLAKSERFDKEYVEIAKERGGLKKARFNLNPKHTKTLGEALIRFAEENIAE